jgi:predicted amidohydrolase
MGTWLLRHVLPVGFAGHATESAVDLLLRDGRIAAVGAPLTPPEGVEVIDGGGAFLSPGWIFAARRYVPPAVTRPSCGTRYSFAGGGNPFAVRR